MSVAEFHTWLLWGLIFAAIGVLVFWAGWSGWVDGHANWSEAPGID